MSRTQPHSSWERLIERVCGGDSDAWSEMATQLSALVRAIASRRSRNLEADGFADIYVRVLDRLSRRDFAALRRYLETREKYPDLGFTSYVGTVTSSAVIDHLRAQPEAIRARVANARKLKSVVLTQLDDSNEPSSGDPGAKLARRIEARRLIERLSAADFPEAQRRALLLWLHGHDSSEIAAKLGLETSTDANRLVRAARGRLRRAAGRDA